MSNQKQKAVEIQGRIRQLLLREWDPIGVSGMEGPEDEYDSYLGGVYRLLASGASEHQIIEYLYEIETARMGLDGNRERLKDVAGRLTHLAASLRSGL
jgi:hypothetical protein